MEDKPLPQSMDAEKGLLGSMLLSPDKVIGEFVEIGSEDYFFSSPHVSIYRKMVSMWTTKQGIDLVTLTDALGDSGVIENIGSYLTELHCFIPNSSNWKYYADILRSKYVARESLKIARQCEEAAYDPAQERGLPTIVQEGLVKISSMFESRAKSHSMPDLAVRAMDRYEASVNGAPPSGIMTGIDSLDRIVGGFKPGNMITIAAPTKGGKSALALNIALHNALADIPVGMFSLEMNADELTDRLFSSHAGIDLTKMSNGGFDHCDLDALSKCGSRLSGTSLFIRDEASMSPLQFRAAARKLHAQHKCKLIIVDYLQLMEPHGSEENRERQVAQFSRTIKTTAAELGIPIIVLAQLNMDGRSRESRAIEQDSNLFMVIEEDEDGNMAINIKYSRSCPRARIPVTFHRETVTFTAEVQ